MTTKKTTVTTAFDENGNPIREDAETTEDLCSVELGETAKGDIQIKSVKVYAATAAIAAAQALGTFVMLRDQMEAVPENHD